MAVRTVVVEEEYNFQGMKRQMSFFFFKGKSLFDAWLLQLISFLFLLVLVLKDEAHQEYQMSQLSRKTVGGGRNNCIR